MKIQTKKKCTVNENDTLICSYTLAPIVALVIFFILLAASLVFISHGRANTQSIDRSEYEIFDTTNHKWHAIRLQDIKGNTVIRIWETNNILLNYQGCVYFLISEDAAKYENGDWYISITDCSDNLIKLYE